jgi:hypothetical protein
MWQNWPLYASQQQLLINILNIHAAIIKKKQRNLDNVLILRTLDILDTAKVYKAITDHTIHTNTPYARIV